LGFECRRERFAPARQPALPADRGEQVWPAELEPVTSVRVNRRENTRKLPAARIGPIAAPVEQGIVMKSGYQVHLLQGTR